MGNRNYANTCKICRAEHTRLVKVRNGKMCVDCHFKFVEKREG